MTTTREGLRRRMEKRNGVVKEFTVEEVARHRKPHDCWIILSNKAYDVSGFEKHPGGFNILEQLAGKDATDSFVANHPEHVLPLLERFYVGDVCDCKEPNAAMKEFHEIDAVLKARGFYDADFAAYGRQLVWLAVLFSIALLPFVYLEQTWATMTMSACALGLFWQQTAFIGHDVGHNAVFHDRVFGDYILSLLVIVGFGVSGQWWKRSHNCHHIVTNSINGDPDIQYLPLFMVDSRMMKSFYSLYHKTQFVYDKLARALVSKQHLLYIPVMALARFNLYAQSFIFILTGQGVRNRVVEFSAMLVYFWWLLELVFRVETTPMAWYWLLLSHMVCGILHVQITLSHFSMECFEEKSSTVFRSDDDDYVRHQVATCLDVDCPPHMDWFHGGLQYQCVHHLWPRLARHKLRQVRDEFFVPFCAKHDIEYHKLPFTAAVGKTLSHMKQQAANAADTPPGSSMIIQAMNLEG